MFLESLGCVRENCFVFQVCWRFERIVCMLFVFEVFRDCLGCFWRVWVVLESILYVFRVLCFSAVLCVIRV